MLWLCIYTAGLILQSTFTMATEKPNSKYLKVYSSEEILRKEAFEILDSKCNVCHRKQNPSWSSKKRICPRGQKKSIRWSLLNGECPWETISTNEEYEKLKKWLFTLKTL